ncbi:MAG: dTDP-4-amino-4,6-dideoxygalactose transaminase [Gaiellaceae bacterium]|nr:dTDP-4-amino-4,6-dideoxygalactose transaminase [Gaiellaceae bacterium]
MTEPRIPFNRASLVGHELDFVAQAVENGHISGDGPFTRRCEELLEQELGVPRALLTTSCTHALELAALLLDVGPGDQVVIPSFTFVSGANAFALRGAELVFADIRPDTLNLDERQLDELVTEQTRVIVPTHYAGVGCELDEICRTAERVGAVVVEDNAHGLFGSYRGRPLGTFGALAAQSFHETKNVTCGEGGAILLNDASLVESAEIIREKGTNRKKFFRGQVDKYTWVGLGSSYVQSDLLAAFLYAQLEAREQIQRAREVVWRRYADALVGWAGEIGATLPFVPGHCEQAYHMFYVLLPSLDTRTQLIAHLRERDILAVFHYLPLHLSDMGRRFGGRPGQCPVTEDATDRLLRLPFFTGLSESDQAEVIDAMLAFPA